VSLNFAEEASEAERAAWMVTKAADQHKTTKRMFGSWP
jgi:hypothetical protein